MVRVFGCKAWRHIPDTSRTTKFDARSHECIHIGFAEDKSAYLLYDRSTGKTHESCDVKFEEGAGESERVIVEVDLGDDEEVTGEGGVEMKEEDVPTSEGQTGEEPSLSNPEALPDEPGSMEKENDSGGEGNGKDNDNNAYVPANVNRPSSPESEPPEPAHTGPINHFATS
jgi:hypothetical protein